MSALQVVRKELRRRRFSTGALVCVVVLAFLGAGAWYPRSWTAEARLDLKAKSPEFESVAGRLRQRFESASSPTTGILVATTLNGSELGVRLSTPDPQQAFEELAALVSRVTRDELELVRDGLRRREEDLLVRSGEAAQRVAEAESRLDAARAALLEGGESALGARIGQLQGELEALALDLRTSRELQRTLAARSTELQASIAALQPDVVALARLESRLVDLRRELAAAKAHPGANAARIEDLEIEIGRLENEQAALSAKAEPARRRISDELEPQRREAQARLATLDAEIAAKARRQQDASALLASARQEISALNQDNQQLRELQRAYDDAVATDRQLKMQLQSARDDIVIRATAGALPFEVLAHPRLPERPDGMAAWVYVLLALVSALGVALARLVGTMLVDDKVRLPETVLIDVELPVLAQIPDYRPTEAVGRVRIAAVGSVLLVAVTVASAAAFLLVLG